ncbi:MAG: hypothetical protein AAGG01_05365 [Planctomycetota bacterium]
MIRIREGGLKQALIWLRGQKLFPLEELTSFTSVLMFLGGYTVQNAGTKEMPILDIRPVRTCGLLHSSMTYTPDVIQ